MPIDINATDFIEKFKIENGTVGIVGHGYVGQAVEYFFKEKCSVLVNDKAKPESTSLSDVVKNSDIIFVCVPTPMRKDGSCYTGIVQEVIANIKREALDASRNLDSFVVVIKSTVRAGFTEEMHDTFFGMRIVFSPEFLTEKNSIKDFEKTNRIIVGGDEEDARVVLKFFEAVNPARVENENILLLQCHPTVAEMVKLYTNGILMTKIMFSNEIYMMCQKLGIDYEEVRLLSVLDSRIGASHTTVPGHDGQLGAGGHCFPKDINNLRAMAAELGVEELMFSAAIVRNDILREDKDWLEMKGRAVIDE